MKKLVCYTIMICMILMIVGCGKTQETNNNSASETVSLPNESAISDEVIPSEQKRLIIDMAGDEVELPGRINRVVCISPTITEYMIAFGLGDKLVGTHKNSLNKVWLKEIYPQISDLKAYSYSASAEDVLETGADLVIVTRHDTAQNLRNAGICAVTVWLNDTNGPYSHIRILGEIFGKETENKIERWIAEVEAVTAEINQTLKQAGVSAGPTVYMINGQSNKGVYYPQAGGGSALEDYINAIGATLALKDFDALSGQTPTEEEILLTNPDVITIGGANGVPLRQELKNNPAWQNISAVVNNRIYTIPIGGIGWDQGYIALPVLLKYFANIFYPDIFSYEITADTISFYKEYFGVELSSKDVENMENGLTPEGLPAWE